MPALTLLIKPASGLCNLRCSYCFYSDVMRHRETSSYGLMSIDTLQLLLRRAYAYAEGALTLSFQGGEPTLAGKDFFRQLLRIEKSYAARGVQVYHTIQTNGVALDDDWMDIFRAGHFLVGVSLDGTQALHDQCRRDAENRPTFARVCANIERLKRANIEYNVLCVVNRYIAEHPAAVINALKPHRYLQFIPCLDPLDGATGEFSLTPEAYGRFLIETFDVYESAWKQGKPISVRNFDNWLSILLGQEPENCGMVGHCGNYFLIEADGSAYPCDFYVLDDWRLGNIRENTFFQLAQIPKREDFLRTSTMISEECRTCPWYGLCRCGCKREREPQNTPGNKTRWCLSHRLFFEARVKRMERMAQSIADAYRQSARRSSK